MICRECRKPLRASPAECPVCLRQFHSSCLIGRVRKTEGKVSYRICRKCFEEKPVDWIISDQRKRSGMYPESASREFAFQRKLPNQDPGQVGDQGEAERSQGNQVEVAWEESPNLPFLIRFGSRPRSPGISYDLACYRNIVVLSEPGVIPTFCSATRQVCHIFSLKPTLGQSSPVSEPHIHR